MLAPLGMANKYIVMYSLAMPLGNGGNVTPSADFVEVRKLAKQIERRFFETLLTII